MANRFKFYKNDENLGISIMEIYNTKYDKEIAFDTKYLDTVSKYTWNCNLNGSIQATTYETGEKKTLTLEYVLANVSRTTHQVDFKHRPKLDFRLSNLNILLRNEYITLDNNTTAIKFNIDPQKRQVLIDTDMIPLVSQYLWYIESNGYVRTQLLGTKIKIFLHRLIVLGLDKLGDLECVIDHQNRNKLNCTRSNLKIGSFIDNNRNLPMKSTNTSGVTGVRNIFNKNGQLIAYTAFWTDDSGIEKSERFNINRIGSAEEAFAMAVAKRQSEADKINNLNGR